MLSLASQERATLLDAVNLFTYLAVMVGLLLLDVLLSPGAVDIAYHVVNGLSPRTFILALIRSVWRFAWETCRSGRVEFLARVAVAVQLFRWLCVAVSMLSDIFCWFTFSYVGIALVWETAKEFVKTMCNGRSPSHLLNEWTEQLRSRPLEDVIYVGREIYQRDLAVVGFRASDAIKKCRRPLAWRLTTLLRAMALLVLSAAYFVPRTVGRLPLLAFARPADHGERDWSDMRVRSDTHAWSERAGGCATYIGQRIDCSELARAREFNERVMPRLVQRRAGVYAVRKAMKAHGLNSMTWHVGHACPDPSKRSTKNEEDYAWNLFAQYAADNSRLGACLVSCAEAHELLGARHVRCAEDAGECVRWCS